MHNYKALSLQLSASSCRAWGQAAASECLGMSWSLRPGTCPKDFSLGSFWTSLFQSRSLGQSKPSGHPGTDPRRSPRIAIPRLSGGAMRTGGPALTCLFCPVRSFSWHQCVSPGQASRPCGIVRQEVFRNASDFGPPTCPE